MATLLSRLRLTLRPPGLPSADGELLARFVERHDQEAFAELVRRHGPMVYGVCRRALGDGPDAEDAYQAVFLVLAKRAAAAARMVSVVGWLYGVACLTARKARIRRAKRRVKESAVLPDVPCPPPTAEPDLEPTIDEELAAVPEKYRTAVVLCELRQLTLDEAAAELGVPRGTVASRLARGRELLSKRLLRRGLFTAAIGTGGVASARVPFALAERTTGTACSRAVTDLTSEVLRAMNASTRRIWFLGLLALPAVALAIPLMSPTSRAAPTPKVEVNTVVDRVKLTSLGGLLEQPSVKKTLELTDEQEGKLKAVEKGVIASLKAVGGVQPRNPLAREQANEKLNEALSQYDGKAAEVLTAVQVRRLKQIQLQRDGPAALLGRFAVRELALTPEQEDKIADALVPLLRGKPFVNLPTKAFVNAQQQTEVDQILAARAVTQDKHQAEAMKHLTDEQKKKWKGMTGEPVPTVELVTAATEEFFFRLYMESLK